VETSKPEEAILASLGCGIERWQAKTLQDWTHPLRARRSTVVTLVSQLWILCVGVMRRVSRVALR
jgi:hypothetical protein